MDKEDEDFRFLFDYNEKLRLLGLKLKDIDFFIKNKKSPNDKINDCINYILNDLKPLNYREQILSKYGLEYSYPDKN